jgi:hypothetical protein
MKTFKKYIRESKETTEAFAKAKQISQWLSGTRKDRFEESLDALAVAAENKEIYNARFNDYKANISSGIQYAYGKFFDTIKDDLLKNKVETIDLWSIYSTADINKIAKTYSKMSPKNVAASRFMDSLIGIPDAMKTMKTYVKSGKPPREPKPGEFIKPMAAPNASKLAEKFMTDAVDSFKKNLEKDITNNTKSSYDKIKNITDPKKIPDMERDLASMIFITRRVAGETVLELKPNPDKIIQRSIDDSVGNIVGGFISKNVAKLALILQNKNEPKKHKILNTKINNGLVENSMSFEFEDGSSFILESSVIFKRSNQGKLFLQYPTRFKNVKLADGSYMKMPSEEKMIKEF